MGTQRNKLPAVPQGFNGTRNAHGYIKIVQHERQDSRACLDGVRVRVSLNKRRQIPRNELNFLSNGRVYVCVVGGSLTSGILSSIHIIQNTSVSCLEMRLHTVNN
jgi:hypothetical protein